MGNWQTTCWGGDDSEIPLDTPFDDGAVSKKGGKRSPVGAKNSDPKSGSKNELIKKNMDKIIKLQALFRGNAARQKFMQLKMSNKGTSRYFTQEENLETVKEGKAYDPDQSRVKKKYTYKSGAVYNGEWKGGFRDGYGTQKWVDGAQYEGR